LKERGSPDNGARGGDETRQRILEAARKLFGRRGFDTTTVREIADEVGITDGALYYHFRSKREILNALWQLPLGGGLGRLQPDGALDERRLAEIVEATIDFSADNDSHLRLVALEIMNGDETAGALRQQSRSVLRKSLHEHLATVFDEPESLIRTEAIIAYVTGATIREQIAHSADFQERCAQPEFRSEMTRRALILAGLPKG